jgi:hypothetical protein
MIYMLAIVLSLIVSVQSFASDRRQHHPPAKRAAAQGGGSNLSHDSAVSAFSCYRCLAASGYCSATRNLDTYGSLSGLLDGLGIVFLEA